jgi:DNA invertase Pin-like site-specific DNA recombinase
VLDCLRKGDVLMVTRLDRLARRIGDLQDIVRAVRAKGASLKVTEQPIDTSTAAGKCFLDMLGVFAEFETNLRRERQLEGIAKAKAAGGLQGAALVDRRDKGAPIESKGHGRLGNRQSPEDQSCLRLPSAWRARVVGGRRHTVLNAGSKSRARSRPSYCDSD